MGCDIHCFLEYKRTPDYWDTMGWEHVLSRDYTLFGHIAGVRRDYEPVAPVRGLPPEPRGYAIEAEHDSDAHHETWLTVEEFEEAMRRRATTADHPAGDDYHAFLAAAKCLRERGNEVRITIWFDN